MGEIDMDKIVSIENLILLVRGRWVRWKSEHNFQASFS